MAGNETSILHGGMTDANISELDLHGLPPVNLSTLNNIEIVEGSICD